MSRTRRTYTRGTCQDCGRTRSTTVIIFWETGMRYRVCGECVRAYRRIILKPCPKNCTGPGHEHDRA